MIAMEGDRALTEPPVSRDEVVAQYAYLCARGARKFLRPGLERADLKQIAAIGLIKACDRYEPELKTPFEAFAWLYVVGELMHYVRDHERLVRPPRRLRALERRYQRALEAMVSDLGREPLASEIACRMGISELDVQEIKRYRDQALPESLDALAHHQTCFSSESLEFREDLMVLEDALDRLNEHERFIILALYHNGYSQLELAHRMGYSRRHISRLHRSALKKMQPAWVSATA